MKKILFAILLIAVVGLSVTAFAATKFNDVPETHWAYKSIQRWADEKVIVGYSDGSYKPEETISRAEFAAMLCRLFEPTKKADLSKYKDVDKKAWYYDDLAKAVGAGIMEEETSTKMKPDSLVTRQEMVVTLNAIAKIVPEFKQKAIEYFSDYEAIGKYATDDVEAFAEREYVIGYPDGEFKPSRPITRAEAAAILDRIVFAIVDEKGTFDAKGTDGIVFVKSKNVTLQNADDAIVIFLDEDVKTSTKGIDSKKKNNAVVINASSSKSTGRSSSSSSSTTSNKEVVITITKKGSNDSAYYIATKSANIKVGTTTKVTFKYDGKSTVVEEKDITKDGMFNAVKEVVGALDMPAVINSLDKELFGNLESSSGYLPDGVDGDLWNWAAATIEVVASDRYADLAGIALDHVETKDSVKTVYNEIKADVSDDTLLNTAIELASDKSLDDVVSAINKAATK